MRGVVKGECFFITLWADPPIVSVCPVKVLFHVHIHTSMVTPIKAHLTKKSPHSKAMQVSGLKTEKRKRSNKSSANTALPAILRIT